MSVSQDGTTANMRQVTLVVSLGLANANSGYNEATTEISQGNEINELQTGDAISIQALDANGNISGTGDAAVNSDNLVVICQRINADDIGCLAPPTTTTPVDHARSPRRRRTVRRRGPRVDHPRRHRAWRPPRPSRPRPGLADGAPHARHRR